MNEKYRSRKFLITSGCVLLTAAFAYIGKLTPEFSNVILSAIASYNMANAWASK